LYQKKGQVFLLAQLKKNTKSSQKILLFLQNDTNMAQKNIKTKPTHFIVVLNDEQIIREEIGDIARLILNKRNEINIILSEDHKCIFVDGANDSKLEIFLQ
jgi:hypothetical protein